MSALIWSVFANKEQATDIAVTLLQEKLIACANLSPNMESVFLWRGKIDQQSECGALYKTDQTLLKEAVERLEREAYNFPARSVLYAAWVRFDNVCCLLQRRLSIMANGRGRGAVGVFTYSVMHRVLWETSCSL